MIDLALILNSWLAILLLIGGFYSIGYVVGLSAKARFASIWQASYVRVLLGMVVTIGLYASFKTGGWTIMLPLPVLAWIVARNQKSSDVAISWPVKQFVKVGVFVLLAILIFTCYYGLPFIPRDGQYFYPFSDIPFYARMAEYLNYFGNENMRVDYLYPDRHSIEPYHYGDIWLIAFVSFLTGMNSITAAIVVANPLLAVVFTLGGLACIDRLFPEGKIKNRLLIVGIFVGFVGGFSALMPGFLFPNRVDTFAYSIASYPKLFWFGCMIPFILLAAYEKNILQVFTLALIVGLSFINVLPTVVAGTGLWIVGYLFFQKPGWRPLIKLVLIGVPVGLFVLLLYQLGKNPEGVTIYKNSYKAADIRTSINIFIGSVLQLLTYSPAFIILLLLFIKKEFRARFSGQISAIWMSVALIVSGMACWAVLNRTTAESVQFFHNMFTVVCGLLSFFVYSLLIFYGRKSYLIGAGIILLLLALYPNRKFDFQIRQIPIDEQQQLTDFVKQVDQPVFAHYNLPSEYTKNYFASNTVVAVPFINLAMEIPRYANYSLNIPFVLLDTNSIQYPFIKTQVEWAPISYYIRKNGFEAMDPDSVMLQFMKEYKIPFLCVPARVSIPENLATLFVDSLYAPSIGWTVYRCSTN